MCLSSYPALPFCLQFSDLLIQNPCGMSASRAMNHCRGWGAWVVSAPLRFPFLRGTFRFAVAMLLCGIFGGCLRADFCGEFIE